MDTSAILTSVIEHFLQSPDFNGYPVYSLKDKYRLSNAEAKEVMLQLVSAGSVDVVLTGNPHIKLYNAPTVDAQLEGLRQLEFSEHFCIYPKPEALALRPEIDTYRDAPYKRLLALGAGQLEFRSFDLSVLEHYRNDPRYHYQTEWIVGRISVRTEHFESNLMHERDKVILQSFGFAYDQVMNRAVAVFLRYLAGLSPEHQQLWSTKELKGDYRLHPDYFRTSILGEWGTRISIFDAFIEELVLINKMSLLIRGVQLFRQTFSDNRPRKFSFLLRPRLSQFNGFVVLLDQMMSENLNKHFFAAFIPLEREEVRTDGKIIIKPYGTISLLEMWVRKYFHPVDPAPLDTLFATFKNVRN